MRYERLVSDDDATSLGRVSAQSIMTSPGGGNAKVSVAPTGLLKFRALIQGLRPDKIGTCPWLPYAAASRLIDANKTR
jgi:hypothetical protein